MTTAIQVAAMNRPFASVSFHCPKCGVEIGTAKQIPKGIQTQGDEVYCDSCRLVFTAMIGADAQDEVVAWVAEDANISASVVVFDAGNLVDLANLVPEDPLKVFLIAQAEILEVRRALLLPDQQLTPAATRMLLIQLFSIIEAYLSDRLKRAALDSLMVRRRLATRVSALKEISVKLTEVAQSDDILTTKVIAHLQKVSFHDFAKANELYLAAFQKPILPADDADLQFLEEAVSKRHDCVHRNGYTLTGVFNADIDRAYLDELDVQFAQMAIRADEAILATEA